MSAREFAPSNRPFTDGAKRLLDAGLSLLLLLLFAPLLLLLALLVKLSSPGTVFFRQQRVGLRGQLFWLYKFRSMRPAAGGPSVTSANDNRITPIGRFLRQWKLDELPQLLNVLKGEMSLVGPRPEVQKYVDHYTSEQRQVLSVRPGITGVSQLEFRDEEKLLAGRDDVEAFYIAEVMPLKLEIDLRYIQERTLGRDILLLLRTALAVLK